MKDDLSKCNQWKVAVGDVNCKIEANDGEEVIEIDETTQSLSPHLLQQSLAMMSFLQFHQRNSLKLCKILQYLKRRK